MSEPILKALMQLFALIIDIYEDKEITDSEKGIVRAFLSRQLNSDLTEKYMEIFEEYLDLYQKDDMQRDSIQDRKRTSLTSMRILGICEEINKELEQKLKIFVIIQLTEFISYNQKATEKELEFLETVAAAFNIPGNEFHNIRNFIIRTVSDIPDKSKVLIINNKEICDYVDVKHIFKKNLIGEIIFIKIPSTNTYMMRYLGDDDLYLNCQNILPGLTYTFDHGSTVRNSNIGTMYYSDLTSKFSDAGSGSKISIRANNVIFKFKNSDNGIQDLSLYEESGRLVGIMGGSGVGKSTLLNVLNGNLKPQTGDVLINGHNLYDEYEKKELKGVIGFVPQDDLLIEELTVFQNLYYNARLCINDFSDEKILEAVNNVLDDLDLSEIRNLKVGNPLKKIISGGQRKRVNIALELIREPSVLFVDEPTSGLSSLDSEAVMNLLKEQTYKGKLVIVNIHQPSSDLYKISDNMIILDRGGYPVYYGNPTEAIVYFKTRSHHVNPDEDQCIKCGTVNPDQVLQIIEAKVVNEHGKLTRTRKVTPREWFDLFRKKNDLKHEIKPLKEKIPKNYYSIPGIFKQLRIFFTRDLLSKLTDRQYLVTSLLVAPLLAVILGFLTKYISGLPGHPDAYAFIHNENLPAYLFMSVVVALFLGLIISSEEIIRDRKILQRESFLNLSRFSYLNSKIVIMFLLSAIQTLSYVLIGNLILGLKGMTLSYWLVLFSTSCFANMLGLNISSGFNSVITIYILIIFLLIPQLLLGGVIVKFDKLHKSLTSNEYVPVIGDLMASRWAYEALAVHQFKDNNFQRNYYAFDKLQSNAVFKKEHADALQVKLNNANFNHQKDTNPNQVSGNLDLLRRELSFMERNDKRLLFDGIENLTPEKFNHDVYRDLLDYLDNIKSQSFNMRDEAIQLIEKKTAGLIKDLGGKNAYLKLMNDHTNDRLAELVLNKRDFNRILEQDNRLIRKYEPIYMIPTSKTGRAHFFAPVKIIGNKSFNTLWFNIMVIWVMSIILYLTLYYDVIRNTLNLFESFR